MKKFGVIHHSDNWISGCELPKFDTKKEADEYVKNFRGSHHHTRDVAEVIEVHSRHEAVIIDQTEKETLHGFKKVEK